MKRILIFTLLTTTALIGGCGGSDSGKKASPAPAKFVEPDDAQITLGPDPLFAQQWHLHNTGQQGALAGEDINVLPVWQECVEETQGCRGEGVTIAVVDSGVQLGHEDIANNASLSLSHNYSTNTNDTTPRGISDVDVAHGTAVAGLIVARDNNSKGGRGVAPRATLASYNLLDKPFTDFDAVDAMLRNHDAIQVHNNSWGFPDCSGSYNPAPANWSDVLKQGTLLSRGEDSEFGDGIAYFWAGGNGGVCLDEAGNLLSVFDQSIQDGLSSTPWVITVNALNHEGVAAFYTEPGANVLVSSYGGDDCQSPLLLTTDLEIDGNAGYNAGGVSRFDLTNAKYTQCMNGTSAATPIAAGVGALVRQANPTLSARDVRMILATTARKNDAENTLWFTNDAGLDYNILYGFGAVDSQAAVTAAKSWTPLPALKSHTVTLSPNQLIPDNDESGVVSTLSVTNSGIAALEYVTLRVESPDHSYIGDLSVLLGKGETVSVLVIPNMDSATGLDWVYPSTHFLNMSADGLWGVKIADEGNIDTGTLTTLTLTVYGH